MSLDICKPSELQDNDSIVAAVIVRFPGHPSIESCYSLRFWDDGNGRAWNYRDASGLEAVIRADSWESAYECFIDEIADDADPDDVPTDPESDLPDGMHWRGNGAPSNNWAETHIAQVDLNGEQLEPCPDGRADDSRYYLIVDREED